MAAVTVDLIKQLRDRTGAGLMDCKGALLANDGDLDKAGDWLREKGLAKAAKKASRIAAEGLAIAKACSTCGNVVILEINCETDFVAKGDGFRALVDNVANVILEKKPATIEEAKELTAGLFTDATVAMGEKFDLRRFEIIAKQKTQLLQPTSTWVVRLLPLLLFLVMMLNLANNYVCTLQQTTHYI